MAAHESFLEDQEYFGTTNNTFFANMIKGGQLGRGAKYGALDAATPLAMPPATIVVLQTPKMWNRIDGDTRHLLPQTVKSLFECHAKSVTGIDITYNLDTQDQPLGHDGQTIKVPLQTKRAEVSPNFTWYEVTGNLIWNIMMRWLFDISNPDTNGSFEFQDGDPDAFTMSSYAMTFLAIQYDQTQAVDRIIDAAVYTNVFPTTTGELGMQREIGTTQVRERSIPFTGIVIHNEKTRQIGKTIAEATALRGTQWRTANANMDRIDKVLSDDGAHGLEGIIKDNEYTQQGNGAEESWMTAPNSLAGAK